MPSSQVLVGCCLALEGCCACHGRTPIAHCQGNASRRILVLAGWVRYQLSVCVLGGATTACRTISCSNPAGCGTTSLLSGTTYSVTSVAFKADNTRSSISNTVSGGGAKCQLTLSGVLGGTHQMRCIVGPFHRCSLSTCHPSVHMVLSTSGHLHHLPKRATFDVRIDLHCSHPVLHDQPDLGSAVPHRCSVLRRWWPVQ